MKELMFISIICTLLTSCSSIKQVAPKDEYSSRICDEKSILDSMIYVYGLPDDYFFYPSGDSICKKIIGYGAEIVPCLVEKIKDTTISNVRIADSYNYTVSDIAIKLLPFVSKKRIDIRNLLIEEFENELNGYYDDFLEQIYFRVFFSNTKEVNYKNRIRFYDRLKADINNE